MIASALRLAAFEDDKLECHYDLCRLWKSMVSHGCWGTNEFKFAQAKAKFLAPETVGWITAEERAASTWFGGHGYLPAALRTKSWLDRTLAPCEHAIL